MFQVDRPAYGIGAPRYNIATSSIELPSGQSLKPVCSRVCSLQQSSRHGLYFFLEMILGDFLYEMVQVARGDALNAAQKIIVERTLEFIGYVLLVFVILMFLTGVANEGGASLGKLLIQVG